MPRVTLEVPGLLREAAGGDARLELDADGLDGACRAIRGRWPVLATHVFAESGALRPHVLLLHNDRLPARPAPGPVPLGAGDRLRIVQAVSGG